MQNNELQVVGPPLNAGFFFFFLVCLLIWDNFEENTSSYSY